MNVSMKRFLGAYIDKIVNYNNTHIHHTYIHTYTHTHTYTYIYRLFSNAGNATFTADVDLPRKY